MVHSADRGDFTQHSQRLSRRSNPGPLSPALLHEHPTRNWMTSLVQACAALRESLIDDPFYCSITEGFGDDLVARKHALSCYFRYSLEKAERTGRCVMAEDPRVGAAAWLLPRPPHIEAAESRSKFEFLGSALGSAGKENYYRIVRYMAPLAARVIPPGAWYLSIIGVAAWALPSSRAHWRKLSAPMWRAIWKPSRREL
jgi:hypothetical protein